MVFIRTVTLQIVVQVRQIGQSKGWIALGHQKLRRIGDPASRGDRRGRSPELKQWKGPKTFGQAIPQAVRHGVTVWQFAPVRLVDRARGGTEIMARRHVVPPEHVGAGEGGITLLAGLPNLLATDESIGLAPQKDFHLIAEQPAVGHDAVVSRGEPRHETCLYAAGDGGSYGIKRGHISFTGKRRKSLL